ncbi:bile acid:sodium symporter family protein [Tsukamurella ocularis]|uniref:bile acid:sodium symporter family protein n=1 Tax=Tsukamurella ocularis TaxID=1970234 RepID=UPI002167228E|nr:bile acid:sodium symporter family protein [Tsukamurella ocularis]MCS3779263.1 sodium/bile acid cotransporter 7 [Tsukamurella ocularis]MCS3787117.1 sodium/bile acid cotransporter 7 [Tsukamurella ocularis]MCS3852508.1 sodium/bile acid cotransporter 7 [Tsukamurella ocularis]
MRKLLGKLSIDGFILAIFAAVALAALFPAEGRAVPVVDGAVTVAIAVLFFLYGARIHPMEALAGLKHWRLHVVILGFTFVVFPIIGVLLRFAPEVLLRPELYAGVLFLTLLPSTVQSSIAFTSIAGGNVPGAIVSASVSNLLGVFITPLLVLALMATTGEVQFHSSSIIDLCLQLLLPFLLGQLLRPWVGGFVKKYAAALKYVDRGSIVLVVYSAFSAGMREHIWSQVSWVGVVQLIVLSAVLVVVMLWLTRSTAEKLGFDRADMIAIQFCGTKKSMATGLPMAAVLFAGQPVGLLVLPLMIFHQLQLMMCAWLAARYGRELERETVPA